MKKLTALVLVLVLVFAMTGCVREGLVETQPTQAPLPVGAPPEDQVYTEPDPEDREASVKLLNYDPGTDAIWQALAKEYTETTGIRVIVLTAASGAYEDVLPGQLDGKSPVTVFFAFDAGHIPVPCADLSGSAACSALMDPTLALTADGRTEGLPFHTESFGLLVHTELLEKTGFAPEDLLIVEGLTKAVRSVTAGLGFHPFAAPALGTPEVARLLFAAAEGDADTVRPIWDLAMKNFGGAPGELPERTGADSFDAFLRGQALFCLASSADLEVSEEIRLLPIPTADGGIVGLGSDGWWCVNGDASAVDIEASIAFLDWVLTEKAAAFEDRSLPYGEGTLDPLTRQALALDTRRVPLAYPDAHGLELLREVLSAYAADPKAKTWTPVPEAFRK